MIMKIEHIGTSCIIVYSCIGDTLSFFFIIVQTRTLRGKETIIMFTIILPWWLLFLMGVQHQQLPENASPTRKGSRRCANQLAGPFSHVWTVCRKIKYTSNYLLRMAAVGKYTVMIGPTHHSWLRVFASNPNNKVIYWVFLKILKPHLFLF